MDELIYFLRATWDARCAQLDENERVARAATAGPWNADEAFVQTAYEFDLPGHIHHGECRPIAHLAATTGKREVEERNAAHIARWDPAWVLAEVECERDDIAAKRRILELAEDLQEREGRYAEPFVLALAQPYAGRDGWREEWRA